LHWDLIFLYCSLKVKRLQQQQDMQLTQLLPCTI